MESNNIFQSVPQGAIQGKPTYDEDGLLTLNLGPIHPATHGIMQNIVKMDGERIVHADQTIGYIHRAFEKIAERRAYYQFTPITDRLNYVSSPINNTGWILAVEKLMGIEVPKRVEYLRVIIMELARIADHLVCNSVLGVDSGALTPFLYVWEQREAIYDIYESICGARLTTNLGRIGGFERDISMDTVIRIRDFVQNYKKVLKEFEGLLSRNRIFMDRTIGAGPLKAERALNYGVTGPNLRATGVDYDVRVMNPYSSYQDFDFIVPVGTHGDSYDRFCVRNAEMWESIKIIEQAIENLPEGKHHADIPSVFLPPKEQVYTSMEALIHHFKIIMGEIDVPAGEIYHSVEAANGELGFYIVSQGGRMPYRVHIRRPCFVYYQAFSEMIQGRSLSDAIITMSSINVIAGELDA